MLIFNIVNFLVSRRHKSPVMFTGGGAGHHVVAARSLGPNFLGSGDAATVAGIGGNLFAEQSLEGDRNQSRERDAATPGAPGFKIGLRVTGGGADVRSTAIRTCHRLSSQKKEQNVH